MDERKEMLLRMYDQLFNDINRHIMVIWQSVGVLIGAFAIFALVENQIVTIDVASSIILLLCAWLMAHLLDASYWYNRNLVMIANIERQFLVQSDLKDIHYYFGKHRKNNMIRHLKLQFWLALGLGLIVVYFHFSTRVYPNFHAPLQNFELIRALPYLFVLISFFVLIYLKDNNDKKYAEFLNNSPGIEVSTDGIDYAEGHGQH